MEINNLAFEMLAGGVPVMSGSVESTSGHTARALVAPFRLPEGAIGGPPPGTTMSLWLDTETLLPIRWSVKLPATPASTASMPEYSVLFTYRDDPNLQPPAGVPTPACIP